MKFAQRLLMGIGGLAAAAALLTILSPKAHALVATLVEVANTRSTPVPNQDVDSPARHPYQQTCFANAAVDGDLSCTMPAVPPNTEVVVQTVSMVVNETAVPQFSRIITVGGGVNGNTYIPLVAQSAGYYMAAQPLTLYMDPGFGATCDAATNSASTNASLLCTITGYTVSLP
jgi:hypothetical protein